MNNYPSWKIIGPETWCNPIWKNKLNIISIYSLSCLSFSIIGLYRLLTNYYEGIILIFVGITSFQSDVIYLGEYTHWRTFDTILATSLVTFYVFNTLISKTFYTYFAFIPAIIAVISFNYAHNCEQFEEYAYWQSVWHFSIQLALITYILTT